MGSVLSRELGCDYITEDNFNKDKAIENILRAKNSLKNIKESSITHREQISNSILISDEENLPKRINNSLLK